MARGTKTQTVKLVALGSSGTFERSYRFSTTVDVDLAELAALPTAAALHDWALSHNGRLEDGHGLAPLVDVRPEMQWLSAAKSAVECALDEVVEIFTATPWMHRVEHSIHAELYRLLKSQPALHGEYQLGSGELTQLVHKEWPETVADMASGASGRRGSFDLAVLSPDAVARADREQFHQGRIAAAIVIEVGLDYPLWHLRQDAEKLIASDVPAPYLLHLSRLPDRDVATLRTYVENPPAPLRVAYVHHEPTGVASKRAAASGVDWTPSGSART